LSHSAVSAKTREPIRLTPTVIARLLAVSVMVNWGWEMAHMGAYQEMTQRPWSSTLLRCFRASVGDAALTLVAAAGAVHLARWPPRTYVIAAALVEWAALASGWWSYTARMPVLPGLNVGLWPVLQLTTLVPLALWAAARGRRRLR
jgi:hypothetical protein